MRIDAPQRGQCRSQTIWMSLHHRRRSGAWRGVVMLFMVCCIANARQTDGGLPEDSLATQRDTLRTSIDALSISGDTLSRPRTPTKSTGVAMLLSAALPGAGQVYNESYWKVPIIAGFGVYFVSQWIQNNRQANDYRDRYAQSGDARDLTVRDFYKNQRDTFTWYFVILYLLNIADAYVDASLYDFSVSDDLSIRFLPGQKVSPQHSACLSMHITF
jgi:Family of unknown function (DUF5683)